MSVAHSVPVLVPVAATPAASLRLRAGRALVASLGLLATLTAPVARAQDMPIENETARRAVHVCASCHGDGGRSSKVHYPSIAGQPALYLSHQLMDFRAQQRSEADSKAYMWGVSALLDDASIEALSAYYAAQTPPSGKGAGPAALIQAGKALYDKGLPKAGVRACASCHGEQAEGAAAFPRLAGQQTRYLEAQLTGFRTRLRPHGVLMKEEVAGLKPDQIKALAAYLHSL